MNNSYLSDMVEQAQATTERVTSAFGDLSGERLNWKPNARSWSVAQCLDHLITADKTYMVQLEAIASGRKETSFWESLTLFPRVWGALVRWGVHPDNRLRTRTATVLYPDSSDLPDTIVTDFARHVDELLKLIETTDGLDHTRVNLTSPPARVITYSVKDAIIIMVTHLERHYRQARAVTKLEGFPQA